MVAIPFFIVCSLQNNSISALLIFILACITDYLDGMLARKYFIESNFGKIMDPLADKLLTISALFIITFPPIAYIHWSVILIILLREITITLLRQYYQYKGLIIPANIWGKVKTTAQMMGIVGALVVHTILQINFFSPLKIFEENILLGIKIVFWIIVAITIVSGVNFLVVKKNEEK